MTTSSTRKQVDYNTHLWHTACRSTWGAILGRMNFSVGIAVGVFAVVLALSWLFLSGATAILLAIVALGLSYVAVLGAHLGYYTPRKFLAEKQKQLLEERARFGAAITALETRVLSESTDRVTASLDKLIALLKARHFTHPIAGLYEAGVAELEPPELDDLCRQLTKRQIAHPFADIPGGADYWMWLLQSSVERGVRLSTQKDVLDYHKAVQLELAQHETAPPTPARTEVNPAPARAQPTTTVPSPKPASSPAPKAKFKAAASP